MSPGPGSVKAREVCIVGVARTPIGAFLGTLSSLSATELGSIAIQSALKRANVDPSLVQEVFFGNVLTANLGQAPARQAALGAGIPTSVICTTINKVCSAGIKATMLAALTIQLGIHDVVVVGGMESMSNAPKYIAEARNGSRLGHDTIIDGMIKDGLWDVYNDFSMGLCGELCADLHAITRDEQDSYAVQSFKRGISAQNSGHFTWEIVPVEVSTGRGKSSTLIDKDEGLEKFDAAKLRKLKPSFKEDGGSVTAGNASSISDGAAALVLVSGEKALQLGLQVIAKIKGYADAAQAPELFTTAPALAIPKAISNAGLEASQIDYYEINEAFSVVALANQKLLGLNIDKVNVHGGAVSLGHPLGCSGARILVTLLGVLRQKKGKYGVAAICNGGGGASAIVFELIVALSHSGNAFWLEDSYAIQSFKRGISTQNCGHFTWEIVPVEVSTGRGKSSTLIDKDEGLRKSDAAKLRKLRPSFKEDGGSVTAGNASSIGDGAAALVLVSGEKALQLGLQVIAKIKGYADAAQAPELFTTAPALAIPKAISNAGLEASQIDYSEINEAFSVVALANQKLLGLNPDKVNVHGGAVSLGHPLGCSGARILVTLLGVLRQKKGKYGVAAICNGGEGASAIVFELMPVSRVGPSSL